MLRINDIIKFFHYSFQETFLLRDDLAVALRVIIWLCNSCHPPRPIRYSFKGSRFFTNQGVSEVDEVWRYFLMCEPILKMLALLDFIKNGICFLSMLLDFKLGLLLTGQFIQNLN